MLSRRLLGAILLLPLFGGCPIAGEPGSRVNMWGGTIAQIPQGCSGRAQTADERSSSSIPKRRELAGPL